ncbi:Murein DD-endopeptidase MepM and murein hydrolase activator NlpD, contain LysM domain [Rhizobiales bacterium GAS191]|nr:Murein DD-endopeptidase MepM and murein hydrolase activator NlpD, contain LysM domain [Rhizobiales bacterium GAS113]SEE20926.1 Murein DD-endopeptidase MepM and murein hydrolase activator NlpD, contain LysM domain [Rhizobiales bacterium GAS191]
MTDRPPSSSVNGSGAPQAVASPGGPSQGGASQGGASFGRMTGALIGDEPPLTMELEAAPQSPHAVNLRWLAGTMLAGIGGMALVGASLLIALDGQTNFASKARFALLKGSTGGDGDEFPDHGTKGDKIVSNVDVGGAKQVARLPDTIKVGDREIIKARVFTRVTTAISLVAANVADEIPPFNPLQVVATAANVTRASDDPVADTNADVSMTKRGLSSDDGVNFFQASLSDEEANAQIAPRLTPLPAPGDGLALPAALLSHSVASTNADGSPLSYSAIGLGPFSSIDVKVVPENVAIIPKVDDRSAKTGGSERLIIAKHGETFEQILRNNGAKSDQINQIQAIFAPKTKDFPISVGQKLRLLVGGDGRAHKGDQLLRVIAYGTDAISAIAAVDDAATFRAVVPPAKAAKTAKPVARASQDDEDEDDGGPSIYESLYGTALKSNVPRPLIDELVRIFAYDVDFQRKAQPGDSFDLLYVKDEDNADPDRGDILYASLSIGDEVRKFYRFQTKDDGLIDFFDELGKSAKKFLLRKPMTGGRFTSPFGYRYHPILGYGRPHTGVDWADKVGSPIFAAGNGTVLKASWDSGYGNRVEIQHNNGYVTTYNHMSAYAKGLTPGSRVRQGQVIGFLGSTGLSTGPHLHYEVIVNGHFVDPLRIKLPRGRELDGKLLADFSRERQHDDEILTRIADPARIAQNSLN